MNKNFILIGVAVISLCACTQQPASVQSYGVQKGAGSTGIHTVLSGDTLYSVSQNYRLPMREIITLNNLKPPYALNVGHRLKLPPPNEYKVRSDDSLSSIARLYEVSPNRLANLNNLQPPFNLQQGQVLRLPTKTIEAQRQSSLAQRSMTARANQLDSNNRPYNSASYNNASISPVERMVLPPKTPASKINNPAMGRSVLDRTGDSQTEQVEVKQAQAVREKISNTPKLSKKNNFMRPIDGKVISSFGPKKNGLHNDGINIQGVRGTPVRAAENGVVVYNGNDLAGYGNLVLIRHENKLMSAYAHLDKTLVKRNAQVVRGQAIGTVGSTGQVDKPQLHFEIRRGSTPLNPDKFL